MNKLNQNFKYEKKHIKLFFLGYIMIFILNFVFIIFVENKNFQKLDLYILKKIYTKYDPRLYKYFLLKNSKPNTVILGTSTALTIDPAYFEKFNKKTLNLAFAGGKINEYYDFVKYIINNKKEINEIVIELKHYSFTDIDFNSSKPVSISKNKLVSYFSLINTKNYKFYFDFFYNYITFNLINYNFNEYDYYFQTGLRNYDLSKKNLLNKKPVEFNGKFSETEYKKLIDIKSLCKKNNIKLILFFGPISKTQIKYKNKKFINKEKKLIKRLKNDFEIIYDFKNFNKDIEDNFFDHIHYDYQIAEIIINKIYEKK